MTQEKGWTEQRLTAFLRHPTVMAVKTRVRDLWWRVRGRAIRRPALPPDARSLLFICKGNICRSPFAAHLAARALAERGRLDIQSLSAGFEANAATSSPPHAIAASRDYGVSLDTHRPAPLTDALLRQADLAVVFEVAHLERLTQQYPQHASRFVLLPLFAPSGTARGGYSRFNIADPYGQSRETFDACYVATARAVHALLAEMAPPGTSDARRG